GGGVRGGGGAAGGPRGWGEKASRRTSQRETGQEAASTLHRPHRNSLPFGCTPRNSRFQLALQFVEKAPVRAVSDDLLRARFDHADLAQAERVEPESVFGIVIAPFSVRDVGHRLKRVVV